MSIMNACIFMVPLCSTVVYTIIHICRNACLLFFKLTKKINKNSIHKLKNANTIKEIQNVMK